MCFLEVMKYQMYKHKQKSSKPVLCPCGLLTSEDVKLAASYFPVVNLPWKVRFLSKLIQTLCICEPFLMSNTNKTKQSSNATLQLTAEIAHDYL